MIKTILEELIKKAIADKTLSFDVNIGVVGITETVDMIYDKLPWIIEGHTKTCRDTGDLEIISLANCTALIYEEQVNEQAYKKIEMDFDAYNSKNIN